MIIKIKKLLHLSPYDLKIIFSRVLNNFRTKKAVRKYLAANKIGKLHLGCGGSAIKDWFNTDLEFNSQKVYFLDASKPFRLPDESFDFIFSEHLLEHLDIKSQINMIQESVRILKKGGMIRIATPDFDFIHSCNRQNNFIKELINWSALTYFPDEVNTIGKEIRNYVYYTNNYFYNWGHRFIHSPKTLGHLLTRFGFSQVKQVEMYQSKFVELRKIETHGRIVPKKYNNAETMVFEAKKL